MNLCPPPLALERMLAGSLGPQEVDTLAEHITGCVRCQRLLDRLSDDPDLRDWLLPSGVRGAAGDTPPDLAPLHFEHAERDTAPDVDLSFLEPPRRAGDLGSLGSYLVEAELGRGGMGVVFRAYDEALQRAVAVKVLRPELASARARQRFVQEARAAARVRHDQVVTVFAVANPEQGLPHFAMELLAGPTLADLIRQGHGLEPRRAAELLAQAAEGLAAAHAAGLVHRDVKPGNVLIDPATGRAKVTDFGLACPAEAQAGQRLTQAGMLLGTPAYMSPEQVQPQAEVDARSDVYGLGVTLYEALTGEVPFRGKPAAVLRQVVEDEPRPPRQLNDAVPRDLETICLKALAKEPAARYPTAAAFAADLRRWLRGEPIAARPIGWLGRGWRWSRRRPLVAALLTALVLSLVGGLGGILWQWLRAERETQMTARQRDLAMDVVEDNLVRITEQRLLYEPGLQPLSRELLEKAVGYYRDFIRNQPQDSAARFRLVRCLVGLAWLTSYLDGPTPALDYLKEALPEQRALMQQDPNNAEYRLLLIDTLNELGLCQVNALQLDQAKATCEEVLQLCRSDPSPATRLREVGTLNTLAKLYGHRYQSARQESLLQEAIGISTLLVEQHLELPHSRAGLALCYFNLAAVYLNRGALDKRAKALARSRDLWEEVCAETPRNQLAQHYRAMTLRCLGEQDLIRRQAGPALEAFTRVLPVATELAEKNSASREAKEHLVVLLNDLGLAQQLAGNLPEAETAFQKALAVGRPLVGGTRPDSLVANVYLVRANLGHLHIQMGRLDTAIEELGQTAADLEGVLARAPQFTQGHFYLCGLYLSRAVALREQGRDAEAAPDLERALANDRGMLRHLLTLLLGLAKPRQKGEDTTVVCRAHYEAAMSELRKLAPQIILFGSSFYLAAEVASQASAAAAHDDRLTTAEQAKRAEDYAARAVDYLRSAEADGYFRRVPARVARLRTDPDLVPLRPRTDFQELLNRLEEEPLARGSRS